MKVKRYKCENCGAVHGHKDSYNDKYCYDCIDIQTGELKKPSSNEVVYDMPTPLESPKDSNVPEWTKEACIQWSLLVGPKSNQREQEKALLKIIGPIIASETARERVNIDQKLADAYALGYQTAKSEK